MSRRCEATRRAALGGRLFGVALCALGLLACGEWTQRGQGAGGEKGLESAELGVFYGGQVQELRRVPWPSDGKRPTFGFRLRFTKPLREELPVRWEVDMPAPRAPGQRVQRLGEARVPAGQRQLDQTLEIPAGAEFGIWNVRVIAGEHLVIDRAVRFFEP